MSTNKFKVGEQVRCVTDGFQSITLNQVYTVIRVHNGRYLVRTDSGRTIGCPEWVFEAVEPKPKFKVGDAVRCVRDMSNLEIGKVYTVVSVCSDNHWYRVVNDLGATVGYEANTFELVQDAVLTPEEVLQYFKEKRQDELECIQPNGLVLDNMTEYTGVKYIFECKWRVKYKPESEIITLNGKRYQAIED